MARKQAKRKSDGSRTSGTQERATELLQVVHNLALELHPHLRETLRLDLDSDLDRDVGLDSLGRAELLLRVDRAFKLRLPEQLIADARTPRDLLEAMETAAPKRVSRRAAEAEPILLPKTDAPAEASTLLEALTTHVKQHGDRPHLLLWRRDAVEEQITYAELDQAARRVAFGLLERNLEHGDRVAIMLPTGPEFFYAFFGVIMAGGIPVPVYPPFRRAQIEDHLRRQAGILTNAAASLLIADEEIRQVGTLLYGIAGSLRHVVAARELTQSGELHRPVAAHADTTALIQYTSGSTGDPKGVVLTHANLLANIRAMGGVMLASSSDVFVSWLPLYHDMGLIGAWLGSLYYGAPAVIMPPLAFLANPARWLWAIHQHRGTLSAAPNFAFELCLKNIRDEDIAGLDLSTLRMVVNGAEPVSPATIARFTERFSAYGFDPKAMAPVYGLAESSVGLAFPPPGRLPIVDRIDRDAFSQSGEARAAAKDDSTALEFVACGQPLPGHEIRIVDDAGVEVAERLEGRLQFKGPSVTKGYFRAEAKTRAMFSGDWAESGDRAYINKGDVFLTGRIKDIIIRGGRNIYPHELEEFIGNIEGVRKGCVAAFPSPDARTGTERLIVLVETRLSTPEQLDDLRERIARASTDLLDLPPDDIVLAPPRTVPKTSSGKIRRSQARSLYESGMIRQQQRTLWWQITRLSVAGLSHRLRRKVRTLSDFAYAAYWWSILVLIGCFTWPAVVLTSNRDRAHAILRRNLRAFFHLTGLAIKTETLAPLPPKRAIIVCNHSSYLDGAVVAAAIPGVVSFVAKADLDMQLVAGPFLRSLGTIFVHRVDTSSAIADTELTARAVRGGERIVSFPEGTLSRMPGLLGFHLGAFLVAAKTGAPVIPVTIRGTRSILRGGQWFPRRGTIYVTIHKPLAAGGNDFEAALSLRDRTRSVLLSTCEEPDLASERIDLTGFA